MRGEITKIDQFHNSVNDGEVFKRIYFELDGNIWAKTDLVIGFRNFKRWDRVARVGNVLEGLVMKDEATVDADSWPKLVKAKVVVKEALTEMEKMERDAKLGIYG